MREFKTNLSNIKKYLKIKEKLNTHKKLRGMLLSLVVIYQIFLFILAKKLNNPSLLDANVIAPILVVSITSLDTYICNKKLSNTTTKLSNLLSDLEKHNIKTSLKNLSNSTLYKEKTKTNYKIPKDNKIDQVDQKIVDNYILFKDTNSTTKGILERNILEVTNYKEEKNTTLHYVLEEKEVEYVETQINTPKKLIRKR